MAARVEYCNRLALVFSFPIFNNTRRQWPMHRARKQILAATHSSQSQSSRLFSLSLSLPPSLSSQWALAHAGPLKFHACVWTTGHKTWRALLHEIHELFTLQRLYKRFLATSSRNFTARMSEGGLRWVSSGLICGAAKIHWRPIYFRHGPHGPLPPKRSSTHLHVSSAVVSAARKHEIHSLQGGMEA